MLDSLEVAAEPTRRRLLQLLAGGEQTVGQLASGFPVSRSAISQHLLLLADAGLVVARKDGRSRFYRLDHEGMMRLRGLFDAFWTSELALLVTDARSLAAAAAASSRLPSPSSSASPPPAPPPPRSPPAQGEPR